MSTTTLFPIAVSSQLDETGVERVHAANIFNTDRLGYTDAWAYYVYFIGEIDNYNSRVAYAKVNKKTKENVLIASIDYPSYLGMHEGGITTNSIDTIFVSNVTSDLTGISALTSIQALKQVGEELIIQDKFDHPLGTSGDFYDIAYKDGYVFSIQANGNSDTLYVIALPYSNGSFGTPVYQALTNGAFSVGYCNLKLHNDFIVVGNSTESILYAYTFNGSSFTLVDSYSIDFTEDNQPGLSSNGDYLYVNNQTDPTTVLTLDSSGFALYDTFSLPDVDAYINGVMFGKDKGVVYATQFDWFDVPSGRGHIHYTLVDGLPDVELYRTPSNGYAPWGYDADTHVLYVASGKEINDVDSSFYSTTGSGIYALDNSYDPVSDIWASATPNLAIPDGGPADTNGPEVTSSVVVTGQSGTTSSVTVNVDITHTYPGDLNLFLTNTAGEKVQFLVEYTTYDAEPDFIIATFTVTFVAPCDKNGTWTLSAYDTYEADTGTINSWSVGASSIPAVLVQPFLPDIAGEDEYSRFEGGFIRGCAKLTEATS